MGSIKDPVHDCPIQGPNTEYQRTLNIKTNMRGWACIWCEMAKKMGQAVPKPPNPPQKPSKEQDK